MVAGWAVVLSALLYLCLLFAVAHWGDVSGRRIMAVPGARATVYALSLGVYCSSWTFFGSVGLASRSGLDFLAIYVGPILVIGLGHRLVARVVRIARAQNSTSVADFLAARYGKSERIAALVSLIALVAAIPYIALQLKAVSASLVAFLHEVDGGPVAMPSGLHDLTLFVALVLAGFAVAFGTRHADATEHQDGLTLAIALESVVKLLAFLVVGGLILVWIARPGPPLDWADLAPRSATLAEATSGPGTLLTMTLLAAFAALLLPRQFHVTVVENRAEGDVRRAAWLFPLYLVLINLFVVPVAVVGLAVFPDGAIDRDMTVLALPLSARVDGVALIAFLGGLSAGTAMVIVESVAVAVMIANHLVMPLLLRARAAFSGPVGEGRAASDLGGYVLGVRRVAIVVVTLLAYAYSRVAGDAALAAIGLLSFAAIAQIGPAFVGALYWPRGTALGAGSGLAVGLVTWAYTLLLPSLIDGGAPGSGLLGAGLLTAGPFGIPALRPTALLGVEGLPTLTHGVTWSLALNAVVYVLVSLARPGTAIERLQAGAFGGDDAPTFRLFRASVTIDDLRATVARYLGEDRARRAFEEALRERNLPFDDGTAEADIHLLRHAEHLLASAIGAASARLALQLLLKRRNVSSKAALRLLDDASAAMQWSRELLQHALDHARQGITVFDQDLRLLAWNRAFADLYDLPPEMMRVGMRLDDIVLFNARRGAYGEGTLDAIVARRLDRLTHEVEPQRLLLHPSNRVLEIRANTLPHGGLVATYTDVTETVAEEQARARAAEVLESRVRERTEELTRLNAALVRAKADADEANQSKTRFLAAAGHDILQPLNAARLYASALAERARHGEDAQLAENVDASLDAVEEIITALLDISRLDAGAMKPQWTNFRVDELFRQLQREFAPMARERGVTLTILPCALSVRSDRRLLRSLLQNLVSNAIKYAPRGRVLVGVRRRGTRLVLVVCDTGLGIPASKQKAVFREFQRLDQGAKVARGLGLGLSIVERAARLLDHPLTLDSEPGRGSTFTLSVPRAPHAVVPAAEPVRSLDAPLAGLAVLAIDNEPAILDGMRVLLGRWGCRVTPAGTLPEALDAVRKSPPAVILADYHLDEGDGLAAVAALRAALGAAVPAVLLTADRSPAVREAADALGIHVLNKPLKPAALRALLAQWRATRVAAE